jgi:hypothetical protein
MVARRLAGEAEGMCTTDVSELNLAQRTAARFAPTAIVGSTGLTVLLAGGAPAVGWSLLVFAASLLAFALQRQVADDGPRSQVAAGPKTDGPRIAREQAITRAARSSTK